MIEIRDLHKSYGVASVLEGVELSAAPGEVVVLLGANGAGKSTIFRCLLGLVGYRGAIRVDGLDPLVAGPEVRHRVGYMPQEPGLHADMTVADTADFYARLRGVRPERAGELLSAARLEAAHETPVGELSGGMRQRLSFCLARLGDPPALVLDEPTAGLDDWSRDFLLEGVERLAADGTTVLMSTHMEPRLRGCGRFVVLEAGRLHDIESTVTAPGGRGC